MKSPKLEPESRVLLMSQRNLDLKVYQCWMYEFEDIISELDSVDILAPTKSHPSKSTQLIDKSFNKASRLFGLHNYPKIYIPDQEVKNDYELFFGIFLFPSQLLYLNSLKGWKERCEKKVCYLGEVWTKDLDNPQIRAYLKLLKDFDHIFIHTRGSIDKISEIIDHPCHFMPVGIDAINFCPYPVNPHRSIDVYSMGRRSEVTHQALLKFAQKQDFFYLYDTTNGFDVIDYRQHRSLSANLIKRSRYFISYKHNMNITTITGGQEEVGSRLFEAAAGGAIMIGIPPSCDAYDQYFDWEDAVIQISYESTNIAQIIADLDTQSERLARIRTNNIVNSLLRHDWLYRWREILSTIGLNELSAMGSREFRLKDLSKMAISQNDGR